MRDCKYAAPSDRADVEDVKMQLITYLLTYSRGTRKGGCDPPLQSDAIQCDIFQSPFYSLAFSSSPYFYPSDHVASIRVFGRFTPQS